MIANTTFRIVVGMAALVLLAASALAANSECQVLAPTGKLRSALYPGTPTSNLDANEPEPRGVGYELGKALAARIGISYEPVIYPNNAEVIEAMRTGAADVAFTNASPARQRKMNFGPHFLIIELGCPVPRDPSSAQPTWTKAASVLA